MALPPANKREQVRDLLERCLDQKLQRDSTRRAINLADEAFRLACGPPALLTPWPELAAYRLAHLLLREAATVEQLRRVDGLFKQAAGTPVFGAMPHLYRLPVLQRLARHPTGAAAEQELASVLEQACRIACAGASPGQRLPPGADGLEQPIQRPVFSLLELAGYFLGGDYRPLEGFGALADDPLNPAADTTWLILGPEPELGHLRLSRDFAFAELTSLGTARPGSVLLYLPEGTRPAQWCVAGQRAWTKVSTDWARMLGWVLKEPGISRSTLCERVVESDASKRDQLRQTLLRIGRKLAALTGRGDIVFIEAAGDGLTWTPDLPIYAAVHRKTLLR